MKGHEKDTNATSPARPCGGPVLNPPPLTALPPFLRPPACSRQQKQRKLIFQNPAVNVNDRELVMKALMTYDALRRHFEQEGSCYRRPDLHAGFIMKNKGLSLNRDRKIIGSVPGIHVGDMFYFRMELSVIGLHAPSQAGVDFISAADTLCNETLAISIVASDCYEDNHDSGDVLIYSGQGGKPHYSSKQHFSDQKLQAGNFALERSRHYGVEIRVIRGMQDPRSVAYSRKIYVYDGLYKIEESWLDKGISGFGVFKYKLRRIPGQPDMGSEIMRKAAQWKLKPTSRPGFIESAWKSENLGHGVVNEVDNKKGFPAFHYIKKVRYPTSLVLKSLQGCECVGGCDSTRSCMCSCIQRNGGQVPYNAYGILIERKPLIYECGDHCRCPPSCQNRVTEKGLNSVQLEVFKTNGAQHGYKANGWSVRSLDSIAAGSFICEYTGEVVSLEGLDTNQKLNMNEEYMFYPMQKQWTEWGNVFHILCQQQQQQVETSSSSSTHSRQVLQSPTAAFLIDARKMGNISRFMGRNSFPNANVFMQFVLHDHDHIGFPHVMFFAMYNIPPLTELVLDSY
ncbi:hypothetical protein KI387_007774 [Taxus chinensis]|uniref:Uncharacterized protein n=1 Tax=Taxus chinensis TaxID=29808 RepID=A0AA38GRZ3_TAXCH|nr:hypothetical protein KI387_007774 [Taxus chinensis]